MAHFAKLNDNNQVVAVEVVSNDVATTEQAGVDFLNDLHGTSDVWKQTSYNTYGGVHAFGGTPFRKNYAQIGGYYDAERDAFKPHNPYPSWTFNEDTCRYDPPTPRPDDNNFYTWDEATTSWVRLYR